MAVPSRRLGPRSQYEITAEIMAETTRDAVISIENWSNRVEKQMQQNISFVAFSWSGPAKSPAELVKVDPQDPGPDREQEMSVRDTG